MAESSAADERRIDDFYAFFTCCFHLKDWLKADNSVDPAIGDAAEALFDKNMGWRWLQVCADLANGSKHLVIDRGVRLDPMTRLATVPGAFDPGAFDAVAFQTQAAIVVYADGGTWNALELANVCGRVWDNFLGNWELLVVIPR